MQKHAVDKSFDVSNVPMHDNFLGLHSIVQSEGLYGFGNGSYIT